MRKHYIAGAIGAMMLIPGIALAQTPAQDGFRAGGRAAGPVGAVVGGAIGTAVELPADVLGFVTGHPYPYERVTEEIVVGQPVPATVHLYPIPQQPQYVYAYVNSERVVVDPRTRRVITIVND